MSIKTTLVHIGAKVSAKAVKYGPTIMQVTGGIMVVGGVALTIKKTMHADEIIDDYKDMMNRIDHAQVMSQSGKTEHRYTPEMMREDLTHAKITTAINFAKHYAPAVSLILGGIGMMFGAFHLVNKRYGRAVLALTDLGTAYSAVSEELRLLKEGGNAESDEEKSIITEEEGLAYPEDGEEDEEKESVKVSTTGKSDSLFDSPFFFIFDESNENWQENGSFRLNQNFLTQNLDTVKHRLGGHMRSMYWVNDVTRSLGLVRPGETETSTALGQFAGWNGEAGENIAWEIIPYQIIDEEDGNGPQYFRTTVDDLVTLYNEDFIVKYAFGVHLLASVPGTDRLIEPRVIYKDVFGE